MEQETPVQKTKKIKSKRIIIASIIFVILISFSPLFLFKKNEADLLSNDICYKIKGTPAWIKDGKIIGYGYGFPQNYAKQSFNDIVNDYLIPNKIAFVWDEKCIYCRNQIREFGDSWEDYQKSGLTIKCNILQ